jgi:Bifunctional DNA primase/polymerase, N-terminal/Protein of unknown function (DUF3987)
MPVATELVGEILASAKEALARGFAILTCEPHDKAPWALYSPHAVNSSTRNPDIALKAWADGHEANYGVGCGQSNLCVVDVDHGINNLEEFEKWRTDNGFPETYTVISGREGFGAHMYYSGAIPTTGFDIGGVTGELKSHGGYVVGVGSMHPSGKKYTLLKDVPIAPLPEGVRALAKEKKSANYTPVKDGGKLIAAGNRWLHLQSAAGKFRNAGLDEDGIYAALRNFASVNCEDGDNYPDEKIREIASAAFNKFDAAEASPIVFFGGGSKIDVNITELPEKAIDGDWIGDLAHLVADGTFIPLSFARSQIKTILAASLDGKVGFPGQPDLHMKHWNMLVSAHPESGKGESWKRTGEQALANYITKTSIGLPKSGWFSSGEHMVKKLCDEQFENKNCLVYFDELKVLFEKGGSSNSTLFSKMIELYDRKDSSAGSLSHEGGEFKNISLSFTGGFTRSSYESALSGKGAGGDGFLSRCVITYTGDVTHTGDWNALDTVAINEIANKMLTRWQLISNYMGEHEGKPMQIEETPEANALRLKFQKSLAIQRTRLNEEMPGMGMTSRLESHFKRDLILRAIFSGMETVMPLITAHMVERSIAWAEHELYLREELWPVDKGNLVERMEQCMRKGLKRHEAMTKNQLMQSCNVHRAGSGGVETFDRAFKGMLRHCLVVLGKTSKGTEKYGLDEAN